MAPQIQIDEALVERYIMQMARYGAYGETGVCRTVYSPEWVAAQDQYAAWCKESGLSVHRDAVGNVWGQLEGTEGGAVVASGSHIDSQCPGGRYDGVLGALAALIALRSLREQFGQPRRTLEAVSFCEEEASRFPYVNFWASRAVTGQIAPDEPERLRSYTDELLADVMRSVGLDPSRVSEAKRNDIETFIELHIEQGPLLEHEGYAVGVVKGINGIRRYSVEVQGNANHAGAFPMDLRRDPMVCAAEIISGIAAIATEIGRPAVSTVGRIEVEPNYPSIIPERVSFTIDARHPDPAGLDALCARHEALLEAVAAKHGMAVRWQHTLNLPPCPSAPALVALLERAAQQQGIPALTMYSGAIHDTQIMATHAQVAMIFVQSRDGRSHTPAEFTSIAHATQGIRLLAAALYELAY